MKDLQIDLRFVTYKIVVRHKANPYGATDDSFKVEFRHLSSFDPEIIEDKANKTYAWQCKNHPVVFSSLCFKDRKFVEKYMNAMKEKIKKFLTDIEKELI